MPTKTAAKAASKKTASKNNSNSTALAITNKETALSTDVMDLVASSAGAGSENISREDLAIPRISIIQSGSPQAKKSEGAYIKGAEEGDFFNNLVTDAVMVKGGDGFLFIPVTYRRANLEWIPQDKGGGFVADHGPNDAILQQTTKNDKGQMVLKNGHEIVTTAEYVGIVTDLDGSNPQNVAISLAKTQLKKAKRLNTLLTTLTVNAGGKMVNPAFCYSTFKVTSVPESNDKGSWMGWSFTRVGDTLQQPDGKDLFLAGLALAKAVSSGAVQVAAPQDGSIVTEEDGETL